MLLPPAWLDEYLRHVASEGRGCTKTSTGALLVLYVLESITAVATRRLSRPSPDGLQVADGDHSL